MIKTEHIFAFDPAITTLQKMRSETVCWWSVKTRNAG